MIGAIASTAQFIAGIGWEPEIRGLLTVVLGFAILGGSVWLLLVTNTGTRLGSLIALGCAPAPLLDHVVHPESSADYLWTMSPPDTASRERAQTEVSPALQAALASNGASTVDALLTAFST